MNFVPQFSIGFYKIAENKLLQTFMIFYLIFHHDNIHKWTQSFLNLNTIGIKNKTKN